MDNTKLFNWPVYFFVVRKTKKVKVTLTHKYTFFRELIDNIRYNLKTWMDTSKDNKEIVLSFNEIKY